MTEPMSMKDFHADESTKDWRIVGDGACAFYPTASFAESSKLVEAIARLAGVENHQPDVDIRPDGVTVRLLTTGADYYGISALDLQMVRSISAAARECGLAAEPSMVQSVLVVPGAANTTEIMPFWQAALGYERRPDSPDEDLVDPRGRGPALWFERMAETRPGGQGAIHIAVWVPHDQAKARVDAALAAGGRIVRDTFAPAWWTMADAAGNEVDISTTIGRD